MGYSFQLAAGGLLYESSHRQDNTYHALCYTSRGTLAGTRNSSMGPPWRSDPMTNHTMSEHSYRGATSCSLPSLNTGKANSHDRFSFVVWWLNKFSLRLVSFRFQFCTNYLFERNFYPPSNNRLKYTSVSLKYIRNVICFAIANNICHLLIKCT